MLRQYSSATEVAHKKFASSFLIYNSAFVAQMAKLVDALVSGTSAARRGGSSPLLGTKHFGKAGHFMTGFFFYLYCRDT
jgi:hypothetical protein